MTYKCEKYPSLSFLVGDKFKSFSSGIYVTTDKNEQAVLDKLNDVLAIKIHAKKTQKKRGDKR